MTTKHYNRVVKATTNKTTSQLISERILLEAKRLMVNSHHNFANIVQALEFSDYAYFSKFLNSKQVVPLWIFEKTITDKIMII